MAPANQGASQARKRNRKRKRRVASSSSESDSDSSSSSSSSAPKVTIRAPVKPRVPEASSSESSDSDSESPSSSSSSRPASPVAHPASVQQNAPPRQTSQSPEPVPVPVPTFLGGPDSKEDDTKEQELRARFRKFWMESVADAFQSDLQELQKARLIILLTFTSLTSLSAGAEVFSSHTDSSNEINEMAIVLGDD
ncbi:hypothetical protein NM688_g8445 [Phlebia brevispora]|uniref:Uncharacterized protein n=1 Tax=Phlebia brevispora TaxID=194682 RepID=A0ACC1RTT1_9APHY|nr:hypothetical protein NM688_g8445 [Phlebia brevispora]